MSKQSGRIRHYKSSYQYSINQMNKIIRYIRISKKNKKDLKDQHDEHRQTHFRVMKVRTGMPYLESCNASLMKQIISHKSEVS